MHWHITYGCMKIFYWCFVKWKVPLAIYFNICEKVVKVLVAQSHLTVTPWTVTWPAPLSMKFFRQEYWRGSCSSTPRNWAQVFCIAAAATKSLQSCPTLCDPTDCSLPGFSVHGILQARTLEWDAISFSTRHCCKCYILTHFSRISVYSGVLIQAIQSQRSSQKPFLLEKDIWVILML